MAHNIWVPLSFVAMLAQANLCRSPLLFQHGQPLTIAWRLIREVLDNVCTFVGDDWDFSFAHAIDDLVANDMLDVVNPNVPTDSKEPVVGCGEPLEEDDMVGWDSDSVQFNSEGDLDSHHGSQCGSPRPRPPSLVQLQGPTPVMEREGSTTPFGGHSIGPSTSMTHAPGRGLKCKREPEDAIE